MTATDELKMLLEQRGERYVENDFGITWRYLSDPHTATESMDGTLIVTGLTPEQAIAATVGDIDATDERQGDAGTCKLDDFADVPFSVDYEIEGYDMDSGRDYATLAECSACGAYIIVPPEYHHVLTCDGDEVYQPYRFCPNCGRRVA